MTADLTLLTSAHPSRWLAYAALCTGVLLIALVGTVVTVALPTIQTELGFTAASLVWVVNAYIVTYGGCMLLAGRLGDLYGHRTLFILGVVLFTLASLACALANTRALLLLGRASQGLAGALTMAVSMSMMLQLFPDRVERAKAMGIYAFISAAGGSIGLLIGGMLTSALNWRWIFLVNVPIGAALCVICRSLLPAGNASATRERLDVSGAVTMTGSLMIAIYAIVISRDIGWSTGRTTGLLLCAMILLISFLVIETRARRPLVPLRIFRVPSLSIATCICVLWAAAASAWYFTSTLYIQLVLEYTPMQVALTFLPANLISVMFALGLSAHLVSRFGIRPLVGIGLALGAVGLALFARAPIDGKMAYDILPSMILLGLGGGIALNPLLLAATGDVAPSESGLASGIVSTASLMGGALGLAVLASLSAARSDKFLIAGATRDLALTSGYRVAFIAAAICAGAAALIGATLLRPDPGPRIPAAHM